MKETVVKNPLGAEPIDSLLKKFAVPSIIAMLVSALYNIVDQFFIGRSVGELGKCGDQYRISPVHLLHRHCLDVWYRRRFRF